VAGVVPEACTTDDVSEPVSRADTLTVTATESPSPVIVAVSPVMATLPAVAVTT
jgi:hypothetical protein